MSQSTKDAPARGGFGSRLGFILAAAGSAVGLGNIWRFPYMAAEHGGGAFVVIYLGFVILIGVPVMLAEFTLGRAARANPVGAFRKLAPRGAWWAVGGLGVLTGFGILAFYCVVAGWTLSYLVRALGGGFSHSVGAAESEALFTSIIASPTETIGMTAVFLGMTALVVRGGIAQGIERASKILMPALFLILIVLAGRSLTLPGAERGIAFLLQPNFAAVRPETFLYALGQALFSLSLGMGAMITYGSYLRDEENLGVAAVAVALSDTFVAVLAGFMIFPALFSAGADPAAGPGLVFVVLPTIFHTLPAGTFFAVAFYALLAIAALTSTMSLLEVVAAYFVDERGWPRERAVWTIVSACLLLAIPSALSQGAHAGLTAFGGGGFLDLQSKLFGNYSLTIGALLICVFVGWVWGAQSALKQLQGFPAQRVFVVLVKYVCPAAVLAVLIFMITTGASF